MLREIEHYMCITLTSTNLRLSHRNETQTIVNLMMQTTLQDNFTMRTLPKKLMLPLWLSLCGVFQQQSLTTKV